MTATDIAAFANLNDGRRRKIPVCGTCGERGHRATSSEHHPRAPKAAVESPPVPIPCVEEARARPGVGIGTGSRPQNRTIAGDRPLSLNERRASSLVVLDDDQGRPRTRGECANVPRPCPYVSCSAHLYLDVDPGTGAIKLNFPHLEVDEMRETCALDVADRGGVTLEEAGSLVSVTRERIRQIEVRALLKLRPRVPAEVGEASHEPRAAGLPMSAGGPL